MSYVGPFIDEYSIQNTMLTSIIFENFHLFIHYEKLIKFCTSVPALSQMTEKCTTLD